MRLDRQIVIQFATKGKTSSGAPTITWGGDVTLWANVAPLSGREYYAQPAEQLVAIETVRFTIRFRSDVRPGVARVMYQGRNYDVRRVAEPERNRWLEIDADCKAA